MLPRAGLGVVEAAGWGEGADWALANLPAMLGADDDPAGFRPLPGHPVLARALPKIDQDDELRSLMEKTIHTVQAAIAKGKLA